MTGVAVLMLAVAVCAVPWRSVGTERLYSGLAAPRSPRPESARLTAVVREAVRHLGSALPAGLRPQATPPADRAALARALDLLGVALLAGLPTPVALAAVAGAMATTAPTVAEPLRYVAARVRLGAAPALAWRDVPGAEAVAPIAPVLARATDGGGSVRAALDHTAQRLRSEADAVAVARAERAAVLVAGPLGLCFLPAFVCLGIVPVVIGLADGMLPGAPL